jgi:ERCC4-type nuclease
MRIIFDTREKIPFELSFYNIKLELGTLKTGDYALPPEYGLPLIIERKRSTGEVATNIGFKKKQFVAELERMAEYERRVIICEFPLIYVNSFPVHSGIPKSKWRRLRITSKYMMSFFESLHDEYGVETYFCVDRQAATKMAAQLIKETYAKLS